MKQTFCLSENGSVYPGRLYIALATKPSTKPRQKSTKSKGFGQMICQEAIYSGPGQKVQELIELLTALKLYT
jgi:hypothetical protein